MLLVHSRVVHLILSSRSIVNIARPGEGCNDPGYPLSTTFSGMILENK